MIEAKLWERVRKCTLVWTSIPECNLKWVFQKLIQNEAITWVISFLETEAEGITNVSPTWHIHGNLLSINKKTMLEWKLEEIMKDNFLKQDMQIQIQNLLSAYKHRKSTTEMLETKENL